MSLKEKPRPLDALTKDELIDKIRRQEAHINQLKNLLNKVQNGKQPNKIVQEKRMAKQRPFDFTKYNTRHIALKIVYIGSDMDGFAVQEDTINTVEAALFEALIQTKLIQSRETSCYHRCGRTDKGVSAFSQVISLDLRSNLLEGLGVKVQEGSTADQRKGNTTTEINYVRILNSVLRPEIRILAWAPVDPEFSARFSCHRRTYKYYFPKADLDIDAMREAALRLHGEHDFRNLCKMDVGNGVVTYIRNIQHTNICEILSSSEHGYSMCELTVVGKAFLWHQIRCIVALLFMIGQQKEKPDIINELLDVEKHPQKPQYCMASELPLVLFDCEFENVDWIYSDVDHTDNIKHLQGLWTNQAVRTSMLKRMLENLEGIPVEKSDSSVTDVNGTNKIGVDSNHTLPTEKKNSNECYQLLSLLPDKYKPRNYKPLLERLKCESLEERIDHFVKRRKIQPPGSNDQNDTESVQTVEQSNGLNTSNTSTSLATNDTELNAGVMQDQKCE